MPEPQAQAPAQRVIDETSSMPVPPTDDVPFGDVRERAQHGGRPEVQRRSKPGMIGA